MDFQKVLKNKISLQTCVVGHGYVHSFQWEGNWLKIIVFTTVGYS